MRSTTNAQSEREPLTILISFIFIYIYFPFYLKLMVIASGLLFLFLPIFFLVFVTYFSFLRVLLLPLHLNVDLCPLHTSRSKNILNIYWYYQYTYIEVTHMRILLIISWFLLFFFSRCFPLSLFLRWIILYTFTPMYWLDSFFFCFSPQNARNQITNQYFIKQSHNG